MAKKYFYGKDGRAAGIAEDDAFDERGNLRDGMSFRVPVFMRDGVSADEAAASVQQLPTQDRAAAFADLGARFGRRTGYALADEESTVTRLQARDAYIADLNDAWKHVAKIKPKEPKEKEPDDDTWKIAGPLSDAQAAELRDAARREYEERLTNAWKR